MGAERCHKARETAGCDNGRLAAELRFHAGDDAVQHACGAVENAALHGLDCILCERPAGGLEIDRGELGGAAAQGVQLDA